MRPQKSGVMKAEYDRNVCAVWFQCVQERDTFDMNMAVGKVGLQDAEEEDGTFVREVPTDAEEETKAAAESCPVDDDKRIVPIEQNKAKDE